MIAEGYNKWSALKIHVSLLHGLFNDAVTR
jgi:hypothetical protein